MIQNEVFCLKICWHTFGILLNNISLKVFSNGEDIEINYENIQLGNSHVARMGKLKFLKKFHKLLQKSTSHYTFDEENSERLMLKYYEYLLKIKSFLKKQYDLEVLGNISRFPINTDKALSEYYRKNCREDKSTCL